MKRVTWHIAKVWKTTIDIWDNFLTRQQAESYLKQDEIENRKYDGKPSPFHLVRITTETITPSYKAKRKKK